MIRRAVPPGARPPDPRSGLPFTLLCLLAGCAAESARAPHGTGDMSAKPATSAAAVTAASAAPDAATEGPPPGMPAFHPVLADARLAAAGDRAMRHDWAGAAAAIDDARKAASAAASAGPDAATACRWTYESARLHLVASLPGGTESKDAGAAFDQAAAAAECADLAGYAKLRAAQAYLRAGDADDAAARAHEVPDDLAPQSVDEAKQALADALFAKNDRAGAVPLWRALLASAPAGARWTDDALRLADSLLGGADGPAPPHADEALTLATRVVVEAPRIAASSGADALRARAIGMLRAAGKPVKDALTPEQRARQAQALLDSGEAKSAENACDRILATFPPRKPDPIACRVATTRAHAVHGDARVADAWGEAAVRCAGTDDEATALMAGAKASTGAGRRAEAIARYQKVEKLTPPSKLADDARFHTAELVRAAGDEATALAMMASIPDAYPEGDVRHEAIFRVGLAALVKGDRDAAKAALEKALAIDPHDHAWATAGRAAYFRATVAQAEGATDDAKARYAALVSDEPLAYYATQAYARLAAIDAAAAKAALDAAVAREPEGTLTGDRPELATPAFARARALLEVGELDAARHELSSAGLLDGDVAPEVLWAVAWMFDTAGAPEVGHSFARGHLSDYLSHWPGGRWRTAWEIAYPRAYAPLVEQASRDAGIPSPLTWAIMREESSFRADARSHSNALGLMQLMGPTARSLAKGTDIETDPDALVRPQVSIELGTKLLGNLRHVYVTNPALAIAAYNGGAGSVRSWLAARGQEDFDVFVEQIPFDETRGYIKRVLRSEAAYAFLYDPATLAEVLAIPTRVTAQ